MLEIGARAEDRNSEIGRLDQGDIIADENDAVRPLEVGTDFHPGEHRNTHGTHGIGISYPAPGTFADRVQNQDLGPLAAVLVHLVPVVVESFLPWPCIVRIELDRLSVFDLDTDGNYQTCEAAKRFSTCGNNISAGSQELVDIIAFDGSPVDGIGTAVFADVFAVDVQLIDVVGGDKNGGRRGFAGQLESLSGVAFPFADGGGGRGRPDPVGLGQVGIVLLAEGNGRHACVNDYQN